MSAECFVVTEGDYSDYTVHCVFEREQDALAYVRGYNLNRLKHYHEARLKRQREPEHSGEFDTCAWCQANVAKHLDDWKYRVERIGWHPAGEVPLIEKLSSI